MKIILSLFLLLCTLTACKWGPDFRGRPGVDLPVTWVNNMPPSGPQTELSAWWQNFRDPQLNSLIERGLAANPDMVTAGLSIYRAELGLHAAKADLAPSLSLNGGGSNTGTFDTATSHGRWNGSLSAAWSPDIWGSTRRQIEAAAANIGSVTAAAVGTRTALVADIATAYFEWISAEESLRISRQQLTYQQHTFDVVARRVAAGFQNKLDLAEATTAIANTRAQIPAYEADIKSCENTLATLLGTTVDQVHLTMPSPAVYNRIPRVPTGLPSDLLRRRPDIVAAEWDLHRATAEIGVQVGNLFPQLSLTGGTNGSARSDFADFFRSAGWSLAASVSQALLNRTRLHANVLEARAARAQSLQAYRKAVLAAFAEVEDCLISYARLTNQLPQYAQVAASSKEAAELSLRLYNAGNTNFLNVAAAERSWLSAELSLISARQQIRISLARLCTALGGGYPVRR